MYHIVFTLSTYREYCHARCAYRGLADEFLYDYYYQRENERKREKRDWRESGRELYLKSTAIPGKKIGVSRYYTNLKKR